MARLTGFLGALALLILAGPSLAANIPGQGSCGPREHMAEWMRDSGAISPGYSVVDIRHPRTGEVLGQMEMSFWSNAEGQTAVVMFDFAMDPQKGQIAFGCVVQRGDGLQSAPIFVPRKGA